MAPVRARALNQPTPGPTSGQTPGDDDVISPETVWRFLRSVWHPLFSPRRYFQQVVAHPERYLKARQAITLASIGLWLADRRFAQALEGAHLADVLGRLGLGARVTEVETFIQQALRVTLAALVFAQPFYFGLAARVARLPLSWRDSTRIAAGVSGLSVLGALLQLFGPVGLIISVVVTLTVAATGFRELGQHPNWARPVAASVLAMATEFFVYALAVPAVVATVMVYALLQR